MNYEKFLKNGEKIVYHAKASFAPAIISGAVLLGFVVLAILCFANVVTPDAPFVYIGIMFSIFAFVELIYFVQQLGLALTTCILITDNRAIMNHGLLKSVFSEVPIDKISGITIKESLFGKILGYGDIIIESSASVSGVKVKYIKRPFELKKNVDK